MHPNMSLEKDKFNYLTNFIFFYLIINKFCLVHTWQEKTNNPVLNMNERVAFAECSAKRYKTDGLINLDYQFIKEENFNLIRIFTVDVRFGVSKQPAILCPGDRKNLEFYEKWKADPKRVHKCQQKLC